MKRIGVWYSDGSVLTVATRMGKHVQTEKEQIDEALDIIEGANRGVRDKAKHAKLVTFELADSALVDLV